MLQSSYNIISILKIPFLQLSRLTENVDIGLEVLETHENANKLKYYITDV